MKRIKLALHYQMGLALVLGVTGGVLLGDSFGVWGNFINGIGNIFLHAINMIVIPLVFLSTALGISNKLGFVSPARRYEAPTVVRPPQM